MRYFAGKMLKLRDDSVISKRVNQQANKALFAESGAKKRKAIEQQNLYRRAVGLPEIKLS